MNQIWNKISNTGLAFNSSISARDRLKMVFFNQFLIVGLFAVFLQLIAIWPFLGAKSFYFCLISVASFIALVLNRNGHFWWSKRFFVAVVYGVGIWSTIELGGAGLYHIGVFSTFAFSLVVFDIRKEITEILIGLILVVIVVLIGEIDLFNPHDFSGHKYIKLLRYLSVFNVLVINSVMMVFVIRLNDKNELKLKDSKANLERQVAERTMVLSDQKQELIVQNQEKEVLLKEVHHRVNNNLQVIVSLINLQASRSDNETVDLALNEIQSRVLSMALVHKKMYQTTNLTDIEFHDYVLQLIENISELYGDEDIAFDLDIDKSITFELEVAISLGLIFNEVITNFFKHAYHQSVGNSKFVITSILNKNGLMLRYSDDGPGFNNSKISKDDSSLGLQLIESLSEQIGADFSYYSERGAVYELTVRK